MPTGDPSGFAQTHLAEVWKERAQKYGPRCVLNLDHPPENYDLITNQQKAILFPILARTLSGRERNVLDFGCGPGRFTAGLANILKGPQVSVVGYDICEELIRLAPASEGVSFSSDDTKFLDGSYTGRFDVVWLCLVLGGLAENNCSEVARRLSESLGDGGRLFFVEHIADPPGGSDFWKFRPMATYKEMFEGITLHNIASYYDCGNKVSIIAGTKKPRIRAGYMSRLKYLQAEARLLASMIDNTRGRSSLGVRALGVE
jgi:SAM-dependent methyltransferase